MSWQDFVVRVYFLTDKILWALFVWHIILIIFFEMIFYTVEKLVSGKAQIGWHDLILIVLAFVSYVYFSNEFAQFKMI